MRRITLPLALLALSLSTAAWADPKADVVAAFAKLLELKRFHVSLATSGNGQNVTSTVRMVLPDRFEVETSGMRVIVAGERHCLFAGQWMRAPMPMNHIADAFSGDKLRQSAELAAEIVALGRQKLDGVSVQAYRVTTAEATTTLYVGDEGYPLRVDVEGGTGKQRSQTVIRYRHAPDLSIEAPAGC